MKKYLKAAQLWWTMKWLDKNPLPRPAQRRDLNREEYLHIQFNASCPYCHGDLYAVAQAGMCTNIACHTCGAKFNLIADFGERDSMFGEVLECGSHV